MPPATLDLSPAEVVNPPRPAPESLMRLHANRLIAQPDRTDSEELNAVIVTRGRHSPRPRPCGQAHPVVVSGQDSVGELATVGRTQRSRLPGCGRPVDLGIIGGVRVAVSSDFLGRRHWPEPGSVDLFHRPHTTEFGSVVGWLPTADRLDCMNLVPATSG